MTRCNMPCEVAGSMSSETTAVSSASRCRNAGDGALRILLAPVRKRTWGKPILRPVMDIAKFHHMFRSDARRIRPGQGPILGAGYVEADRGVASLRFCRRGRSISGSRPGLHIVGRMLARPASMPRRAESLFASSNASPRASASHSPIRSACFGDFSRGRPSFRGAARPFLHRRRRLRQAPGGPRARSSERAFERRHIHRWLMFGLFAGDRRHGARSPGRRQRAGGAPTLCRTISRWGSVTEAGAAVGSASIASSRPTVCRPISCAGWRIVVSGGAA